MTAHIPHIQTALLEWYDNEFRDLPWRQTSDPYAIWVSEIMLQQTQVKTVVPYYLRFIDAFPKVFDLAGANQDQVLKLWEGLGYYARARNLHKAAKQIVNDHNGIFPNEADSVRSLSGIGPYTAAAILSIAFNQQLAVVDGNVNRVLCRLYRITTDPKSHTGKKEMETLAQQHLSENRPGDYNQAIMELGAMVCRPKSPKCMLCPINKYCAANKHGDMEQYPVKPPSKALPHHLIAAGIIYHDDKILIAKRPDKGLLGGLWEFPGGKVEDNESPEQAAAREIKEELDIDVQVDELFDTVKHAYTHFSITMQVFNCKYLSGTPKTIGCADWKWVTLDTIDDFAFPRANRKILDKMLKRQS